MIEEIYALATSYMEDGWDENLLELYCKTAKVQLENQLKAGITPEECQDVFALACAWTAIAYYGQAKESDGVSSFSAGDFSVTKNGVQYGQLRHQAEQLLAPFSKGQMGFMGVAT